MAFLKFEGVRIAGVSAAVPRETERNAELPQFEGAPEALALFVENVGVRERRVSRERNVCASDLCCAAAERLLDALSWKREEIDALVFVSQTADYRLPATSCLLQHRLSLPSECAAFDISLGCSGWVYGMSALSALVASGNIKKALLLAGDTPGTHLHSLFDKTSAPLFGDAGTATALEFSPHSAPIHFHLATEGAGANAIFLPDGGARNPVRPESLELRDLGDGVKCTPLQTRMNGMDVFAFAVSRAPKSVKALLERFGLEIDAETILLLHQANRLINEKIRKKLGVPAERCPSNLAAFGNTSCASVPLIVVSERENCVWGGSKILACGFGVGLSVASLHAELPRDVVVPACSKSERSSAASARECGKFVL